MKKTFTRVFSIALLVVAVLNFTACNKQKFNVNGTISEAKDSILYFENMSLNGPEVVDSVRLNADGVFRHRRAQRGGHGIARVLPPENCRTDHQCGRRLNGKHYH